MKINKSFFVALFTASCAVQGAFAASSTPAGFTDNLDEALQRAKASGRYVLVDFSGSDWCGWCKRLDKEVFSKPEFLDTATNTYELVFIDSPSDETLLSERAKGENPKLVEKYDVHGFPTVLMMNGDGEVVFKTGYRKGGPEKYLKHLKRELKNAPQAAAWVKPLTDGVNAILSIDFNKSINEAMKKRRDEKGGTLTRAEMDAVVAPYFAEALPRLEALLAAEKAREMPAKGISKSVRKEREEMLEKLESLVEQMKKVVKEATPGEAPGCENEAGAKGTLSE